MKVLVIGGTGLIGTQLVRKLRTLGHEVAPASPKTGVDVLTGAGLAAALAGVDVVVDVANSPSFEAAAVMEFFETSGRNLMAAEATAGIKHHIALSVVGVDRLPDNAYFRAKVAQENLIKASGIPYTILRATQFFEFMGAIAYDGTDGQALRLTSAAMQPIASNDVADALARLVTEGAPRNATLELAGPERQPLDRFVRRFMISTKDARTVITDPTATYFGAPLTDESLVPGADPLLGQTRFEAWLADAAR
jgi:uncharacterized protein YbjT (DUF2867 family)